MSTEPSSRVRSSLEERVNVISHFLGLIFAIAGTAVLVWEPLSRGLPLNALSGGVFGVTATAVFLSSTLYHATSGTPRQALWLRLDQSSVFLLIAGTYTPLALIRMAKPEGYWLLGIVWALALVGVGWSMSGRVPSTLTYVGHVLVGAAFLPQLLDAIPPEGLLIIVGGLLAYLVGALFYLAQGLVFNHFVWHLGVLIGAALHFGLIYRYVALG